MIRKTIHQITLRGLDELLSKSLRKIAKENDMSLNKAALKLLRAGAGLDNPHPSAPIQNRIGERLDRFFKTWSERDAKNFLHSVEMCKVLDRDFWS